MNFRHRRAPSATYLPSNEDNLENPAGDFFQFLDPKETDFKQSESDLMSGVRNWVNMKNEDWSGGKVMVCEQIDVLSEAETEDVMDELNEMIEKILKGGKEKRKELERARMEIKKDLSKIVMKDESSRKGIKFKGFL